MRVPQDFQRFLSKRRSIGIYLKSSDIVLNNSPHGDSVVYDRVFSRQSEKKQVKPSQFKPLPEVFYKMTRDKFESLRSISCDKQRRVSEKLQEGYQTHKKRTERPVKKKIIRPTFVKRTVSFEDGQELSTGRSTQELLKDLNRIQKYCTGKVHLEECCLATTKKLN